MELLKAIQLEKAKLKKEGYKPTFRGDTGINILKLSKDYDLDRDPALDLFIRIQTK